MIATNVRRRSETTIDSSNKRSRLLTPSALERVDLDLLNYLRNVGDLPLCRLKLATETNPVWLIFNRLEGYQHEV